MCSRIELGKQGEKLAVDFLKKRRYKIVEKNFRCKFGEIDIIALEGKTLVFVEVKTRSSHEFGCPQAGVTPRKKAQMAKVAFFYLQENRLFDRDARFDVVAIYVDQGKKRIELIRNAFELSG